MKIVKRNGKEENLNLEKITSRINSLRYGLSEIVDPDIVSQKVISGCYDLITSEEIDTLAYETAAQLVIEHPDYSMLASRLAITSLNKSVPKSFTKSVENLYNHIDPKTGEKAGMISDEVFKIIMDNKDRLNSAIIHKRDERIDFFGFKTLERSYLLKIDNRPAERIQHMWMRVSVGIWGENIDKAIETYNTMSNKYATHATPTLFNSGTKKPQMSSCFLIAMKEDSIDGIYDTLKQSALISQSAGGIGLHIHNVRATGSYIKGTNGYSNGIVPMLRNFDMTARYVDQGGGKRKGSIAIYLEPWHADIFEFLDLKKNHGKEEGRARDLFYALWVSDLFMERVNSGGKWTLFSPDSATGLSDCYGEEFDKLYVKYEEEGKGIREVDARKLWEKILESQQETGTPYMLYKDAANIKSNQKNIGVIKSSNLCTEIMEVSNSEETAVCNLASLALPMFVSSSYKRKPKKVDRSKLFFDHDKLYEIAYQMTENLNQVIDRNYYPTSEAKTSNMNHRPIGLGVQGLADAFAILGIPFDSKEAKQLNKDIFETIYFAAVTASADLAERDGAYSSFKGSPMSRGIFQFDMWEDRKVNKNRESKQWEVTESNPVELSGRWDWDSLKVKVKKSGVRNSLLLAPMPTASTSQILGNNECFEPYTSNLYLRRVLSGEFPVINKHLVNDLVELDLWNKEMSRKIISENGSVQNIPDIPTEIKERYKTVWEMSMRDIIDMAADRGFFIDQSQSMNLFIRDVNAAKLTGAHFYGWLKGLKTGMYYLRSNAAQAAKSSLGGVDKKEDVVEEKLFNGKRLEDMTISEKRQYQLDNPDDEDGCLACGA